MPKQQPNGIERVLPFYQKEDPDSDDDEKTLLEEDAERSDEPLKKVVGHPKGTKNVKKPVYVEPEKVSEMVMNNQIKLTKSQQKALLPKKTRTITETERARIIEMGKKGREAMLNNKAKREEEKQQKEEEEKKRQELINAKKIRIEKPSVKKRVVKRENTKVNIKQGGEGDISPYESDSEDEEGFSTDTRTIKKVSKKLNQINNVLEKPRQVSYKELSLLDKLNLKF